MKTQHLPTDVADRVIRDVAAERRVGANLIRGNRRFPHVVEARQDVMWRLRRLGYSFPEIGYALNRDHATVMFGCRRHEARSSYFLQAFPQPSNVCGRLPQDTIAAVPMASE